MIRGRAALLVLLLAVCGALAAGQALAAGSGSSETTLVNVADTRSMEPGVSRFIAGVYNRSLWLYGLLVVGVMAGMGLVLGLVTDRLVGLVGINLGKITHYE